MPACTRLATAICSATLFTSTPVGAETFHAFDPATLAQGGSGVAVADPASATLMNPASLAALPDSSDFNLQSAGTVRAFDQDELIDAIDDFQDAEYVERTDNSVTQAEQTLSDFANGTAMQQETSGALRAVADETRSLNSGLQSVTGKPAEAEFAAALAASVPGRTLGVGVAYSGWGTVSGTTSYDDAFLGDVADAIDLCADAIDDGNEGDCNGSQFVDDTDGDGTPDTINLDAESDLQSRVFARGIAVEEVGVTLAHEFDFGVPVAIGITPKSQDIQVFDYVADVNDADGDDIDASTYTREFSDANLDLGALARFGSISTGLTVRNAVSREYETTLGNTVEIEPQARAGLAFDGGWYRLAGDLDLTRNSSVGFSDDHRFASIGGTIDILGWAQLRGGYRVNTAGDSRDIASVGIGLSPFRVVRIEVAVAGNDNEIGGAATLGVTF